MLGFNKKKKNLSFQERLEKIKKAPIPKHIAIIMDGNGRWAKQKLLPRIAGHKEGMEVVRIITKFANSLGVEALTLYAFSTENWKRSKNEVNYLMKLPEEFLGKFLPELIEENVCVHIIGEREHVPSGTLTAVNKAVAETKDNTGLVLNFAFNYGSRAEIVLGINQIIKDVKAGEITGEITEEMFSSYLMTNDLIDPDLLIRTSGEIRLSNFMLWQLAYTEFYFTDILWPDFREVDLLEAIEVYQSRNRRFGGRIEEEEQ